ncbi:MAG: type IV secretory system conjugative DNA transfer family protein, partial [Pseudomonadota bacterium]
AGNTPMTGFVEPGDLQRYQYQSSSVYLGTIHEDHGVDIGPVGINDPRGIFVQAGSRSGKGRTIGIQNAIRWPGPLLMIDPKGEAASITAMRRGTASAAKGTGTSVRNFLGQKVAILDPFGETRGPARKFRTGYNPLIDIDPLDEDYSEAIRSVVKSIVIPDEGGAGAHFSETTAILLRGVIETLLIREVDPTKRTLPVAREILFGRLHELKAFLAMCPSTPAGFGRLAATAIADVGPDEWGSMSTTMARNIEWLGSAKLLRDLGPSDFSLVKAVQEGWSIYVVLPPTKMHDYRAWMRIIVRTALNAKVAMGIDQPGPQTLFMLDEFPLLGHFQIIEESAGFLAGYGIKLMPFIQNLTQLSALYPKNWEAFFTNSAATVAWAMDGKTEQEFISYLLGKVRVWEESFGSSDGSSMQDQLGVAGGSQAGFSSNVSQRERPVRFNNELHEQAAPDTGRAFVIPGGGEPFIVRRMNYDAIRQPGLFDAPQYIAEWERRFGSRV